MTRPRLLDLFAGAGGATRGYQLAGFHVTGVDISPQPHYIGDEFHLGDAMRFPLDGFDAIHASPPCQAYSAAANIHDSSASHPDLVAATRERLQAAGVPWVIENVERSPLAKSLVLCGSMFGLGVRRHRIFESNALLLGQPCGAHDQWFASVFGGRTIGRQRVVKDRQPGTRKQTWDRYDDELAVAQQAMGIDWMTLKELSEAIPPAYTQFIGEQLLAHLGRAAA